MSGVQIPLPLFLFGPLVKRLRRDPLTVESRVQLPYGSYPHNVFQHYGSLAQLGEHLPYKQRVTGSSPVTPIERTFAKANVLFLYLKIVCIQSIKNVPIQFIFFLLDFWYQNVKYGMLKTENHKGCMMMKTKEICLQGLMTALVTVATMLLQIPVSATNGYIHLGDSMILLIGVFFGWRYGMIAGGVGSALADLLSGYAHWAPFTLLIKGLMGFVVGKVAHCSTETKHFLNIKRLIGTFLGIVCMVTGYFFGSAILQKSFAVAATSIPENIVQGGAGWVIFLVVGYAFYKAKIYRYTSVH